MKKKVVFLVSLILFFSTFVFLNVTTISLFDFPVSPVVLTGRAIDTGVVTLFVSEFEKEVTIHSPKNITYNFSKGVPYLIDLNVSANFDVEPVNGWNYSLFDLRHNISIEDNTFFTPNSSIVAVRWGNLLTVSANELDATWVSSQVIFNVNVPNSAPILGNISDPLFVCENERLGDLNESYFNATDVDEDVLIGDISPKNPFYILDLGDSGWNVSLFKIVSLPLTKSYVKDYNETIQVVDTSGEPDSTVVNISVIEINNPPVYYNPLSAITLWLVGANSTFNYQYLVNDTEISLGYGGLNYSLTWGSGENLFGINESTGVMNYTPSLNDLGKTYHLTAIVCDDALENVHENFSICAAKGRSSDSICVQDNFTLTVTDENRAPEITNYTPFNVSDTFGDATIKFNVTVKDEDMVNAYPDIDWYVNGVWAQHVENLSNNTFSLGIPCGVSGAHNVTVITTDGLLEDSQEWVFNVIGVACPSPSGGGGGGGGGGASGCFESWVCDDWDVCQNVKRSFDAGALSIEDYSSYLELCNQNDYDERFCGFQITLCHDINECNNTSPRIQLPLESRVCYFTEDPNCNDGITNCHDGSCELLVDCGGPCAPCATCSDGKQNQGETGVDCGGPCPYLCPVEEPMSTLVIVILLLSLLILLIITYIAYKVYKINRHRAFLAARRLQNF